VESWAWGKKRSFQGGVSQAFSLHGGFERKSSKDKRQNDLEVGCYHLISYEEKRLVNEARNRSGKKLARFLCLVVG